MSLRRSPQQRNRLTQAAVWLRTNDRWLFLLTCLVFLTLVLTGTTTSNITHAYLQPAVGGTEGLVAGTPKEIRWDEYLAGTPLYLSIMATHDLPTVSVLAEQAGLSMRYSEGGFIAPLVFFDGTLLRLGGLLPESMVFSFHWWFPSFLFLISMPLWFRRLGFDSRYGWLAGLVVAASPSVAWWSLQPVNVMAFALAGSVALLSGFDSLRTGHPVRAVLLGLLAAVLLASMPAGYLIWTLLLSAPLLIMSVLRILLDDTVRQRVRWIYLCAVGALTVVLAVGMIAGVRGGIEALAGTTYPGDRRLPATPTPFEVLFGAPLSYTATRSGIDPVWGEMTLAENNSEMAVSWTVSFLVLALLATTLWYRLRSSQWRRWLPVAFLAAWGTLWLAWSTITFGDISSKLPVFSQVTSLRAAQVVGILGVIAVCLVLAGVRVTRGRAVMAAGLAGATTLYAGSLLQRFAAPDMSTLHIWGAGVGTAVVVFLALRMRGRLLPMIVIVIVAAFPAATANPITSGLATYRDSDVAQYMSSAAADVREAGEVWASDFRAMDAMMLANGVPSITGQQFSGPIRSQWMRLDPTGAAEDEWNRGGSRIRAVWRDEPGIDVESNGYNVITIEANPCSLHEAMPELTTIFSREPLTQECLVEVDALPWQDTTVHVYRIDGTGGG